MPSISVIIPSYNHARYVDAAINSVYEQTFRDMELIIVDDGSTDESLEVISAAIENPPFATELIIQENQGAHDAIMRGISAASGEYLSVLNSDDIYYHSRFETLVPAMQASGRDLAFSGLGFMDKDNKELAATHAWPKWYAQALLAIDAAPTIGFALLEANFSVTSGNFVFTRSLYEKLGGFSGHKFLHDWQFLIRSFYYNEPLFVATRLMDYRVHDTNTTETVRDLLQAEAVGALSDYFALYENGPSPNRQAPSRENWPRFFDSFCGSRLAFFAPGKLAEYVNPLLEQAEMRAGMK